MELFGQKPQATKRSLRVVPRAPGDLTPLDPAIAEALRRAGLDPEKFSVAPGDAETAIADAVAGVGPAGAQVAHAFRFLRLADALRAIEQLVDADVAAHISKAADGWLVAFEAKADPSVDEATRHARFATVAAALGAEDRGTIRRTLAVNVKRTVR